MHLRATGRGDLAGNRLLNVLTTAATTGTTRTLRAQVKYLSGHPEILFRLHGGWLETTGSALGNIVCGTPGAPNSRALSNAGPAISEGLVKRQARKRTPLRSAGRVADRLPICHLPSAICNVTRPHSPRHSPSISTRIRADHSRTIGTVSKSRGAKAEI